MCVLHKVISLSKGCNQTINILWYTPITGISAHLHVSCDIQDGFLYNLLLASHSTREKPLLGTWE